MRLLLIAVLLSTLLLAGCTDTSSPPPPQYKPPAEKNLTNSTPSAPKAPVNKNQSKPVTPPIVKKNTTNTTTPKVNTTTPKINTTSKTNNTTAPVVNTTPAKPAELPCMGVGTADALECLVNYSISNKNVVVCTQLTAQEDRYKCFTRWCYSGARDYNQCNKLTNTDDRLGCLMKCNPNFNT